jgi:thiol-disulfide isomerase/thioredoxin
MRGRRAALGAAFLALLSLAMAAPARAADLLCRPTYDFSVEVDGNYPPGACFYRSDAPGKWFIDIPATRDGLLMDMQARKIYAVPRDRIVAADDGKLKVKDDLPAGSTAYAFSLDGAVVQFQTADRKVRILPVTMRPPIIGHTTIATLESDRPEYREGIRDYIPEKASVATIAKYAKPVEIEAYFATWCPHCKEYMPKFIRVVKDANNPKVKLDLVGVPKGFSKEPGPWQGKNLTAVPTIIVKVEGREITRMGARPDSQPEIELAGILDAVK